MNANYKMTYKMRTATKYLTPRPNSNRQARMECPRTQWVTSAFDPGGPGAISG